MPILFALLAAALWGAADFFGGVGARHTSARLVAVVSQSAGLVAAAIVAPFLWGTTSIQDIMWGLVAGVGGGLAVMVLYRGFQVGRISLTSPIAAVGVAVFPAIVSIVTGDPVTGLQYAGGVLAMGALWVLVGGGGDDDRGPIRASVFYGVLAGIGFALLLIGLGQVEHDIAGPLVASRVGGALALVTPSVLTGANLRAPRAAIRPAMASGAAAVAGNIAFLVASGEESLAIVSVLAALFPAFTVGLAVVFLGEALTRRRLVGLALALVGIAVIVA